MKQKRNPKAKEWTVCGYFEDNGQPWVEYATAATWDRAVKKAVELNRRRYNPDMDFANYIIVCCFLGEVVDYSEHSSVCTAADFLEGFKK